MLLICRDFTGTYIATVLALIAVDYLLVLTIGREAPSGANLVPLIVGAMIAGQYHAKRTGIRPPSGFSWLAAFWMTVISVALGVVAAVVLLWFLGADEARALSDLVDRMTITALVGILFVVSLICILITRLMFGIGITQGLKTATVVPDDTFD